MKQPKVPNVSVPPEAMPTAPAAPSGPRHRFFINPPAVVTVRLGDLAAELPLGVRAANFDADRQVELPCEDIFNGPVPKVSLTRLADAAPGCFHAPNFPDTAIKLPAARLALAYQLTTVSELIEVPAVVEPERSPFAPLQTPLPETENFAPVETPAGPEVLAAPAPAWNEPTNDPEPPAALPSREPPQAEGPAPVAPEPVIAAEPSTPEPSPASPPATPAVIPPAARGTPLPQSKRPFAILPIFRRKEAEPESPPTTRIRVEIPKPRPPLVPLVPKPPVRIPAEGLTVPSPPPATAFADVPPWQEPPAEAAEPPETTPPAAEPALAAEIAQTPQPIRTEAVLVETEHLPKAGKNSPDEIPEQEALQAIFMTEEFLAVDRVMELCGGLPGIKSCVLSHGSAVLASHNVPDTIDLVSLSAHAVEMLSGMRASSAKMGIGAVPAVTVHSDKGPITFFHQEDLCLFVMHKDRGFIPGVREKLQQVVEELTRANLPLPISPGRPALEKWK